MKNAPHKMALTETEIKVLGKYRGTTIIFKEGRQGRHQIYCTPEEFQHIRNWRAKGVWVQVGAPAAKVELPTIFQVLSEKYTHQELMAIAQGALPGQVNEEAHVHFQGQKFRFAVMSDLHLGSKYTSEERVLRAFKDARDFSAEVLLFSGDITEGLSSRPGHVYELSHIGYEAQKAYTIEILKEAKIPIKAISGNHDEWYKLSNGANIIKDVANEVPDMEFIGEGLGTVHFNEAVCHLHHGLDKGAAYALSYRIQKIVEAYEAGTKPQLLIAGHDHKAGYFFIRDVHCILAACLQSQTPWMQRTRKEAHKGYWLIEIEVVGKKIISLQPTFKTFYK